MNDMYNDSYFCMEFITMFISPFHVFRKTALVLALSTFWSGLLWAKQPEVVQTMETIEVTASADDAYVATQANSVLKSDKPLFETAQSVSVITREQLDQKQATTLTEALNGVAGVSAGQYGRRGWDDMTIRGQLTSSQVLVDGMRTATSTNFLNSMDISGLESVQVVKGPASVGFGQMQPGGVINLATKRPKAENFNHVNLSYGSYDFKQGTFDMNYAPNGSEKGAFRLNGRISDQEDATDYVFFKNHYLAPSYNVNLGEKSDLVLMASYLHREYIRQQGLPVHRDAYKTYDSSLFFGEPEYTVNDETYRIGYEFAHHFNNDWKFKQNFSASVREADAEVILAQGTSPVQANGNMNRQLNDQLKKDTIFSLDSRLQRVFNVSKHHQHDVNIGLDAFKERSHYIAKNYRYSAINLNNPVYGAGSRLAQTANNNNINRMQYLGLYAKDQMTLNDRWIIGLAGRHDWTLSETYNVNTAETIKNSDNAFTGNASLMYKWNDKIAPYMSYATSFIATTDLGENGQLLNPEKGEQFEVGLKFQSANQQIQGALSYYDLTRKNVTEAVTGENYSIQIGEQKTKGFEFETTASLSDQWNVLATYSYIPTAKTTESLTTSEIGRRINHIPKHAYSLSTQYFFEPSHLGWFVGGGVRYQGEREASRGTIRVDLPAYTLFDVQAGYEAPRWGANLAIRNLFDEDYYVGTTPNASMIMFGEPMTARFNLKFKF